MNLLKEGIELKTVIPTDSKQRLTIDGHTKDHEVYKIKLDLLYYNDQNDRIATQVNEYKQKNHVETFDINNKEHYNDLIHKFIVESNPKAFKKTLNSIDMTGQQCFGVVLSDGRIIDGNRRYTCIRTIQEKNEVSQYFEAVILDYDIEQNKKQIKMLELQLQHGVEEKVSYNPIDRLVGIHHDIVETKLLTEKEYAASVCRNIKDIKEEVAIAKLLVEFLDFFNMSKQFHIARDLNLVDPLKDLHKMLQKINNEEQKEKIKQTVFANLFVVEGDKTRYARKIGKIVTNKKHLDNYIEEQAEVVDQILDEVCNYNELTNKDVAQIKSNKTYEEKLKRVTEKFVTKVDSDTTKNQSQKLADKAIDSLDNIDINILKKLSQEQQVELKEKLDTIEGYIIDIRKQLNV